MPKPTRVAIERLDSTHDLARVFRVPGSFNGKADDPAPVRLLDNGGPRYTIEQVQAEIVAVQPEPVINAADAGPGRPVEELLAAFPQLDKIARHQGKAPKDPSPSGWDYWLACASVRSGLSDGEIAALIGHARLGDPKGARQDYIKRTISKARETAEVEASDPAQRISRRWNLKDDPIVSGSALGDIASGSAIIYLERRNGKRLRFPRLADLFDARAHTRIVSLVTRATFTVLTNAEATEIEQLIIQLCGGEDDDPRDEARQWVTDFIAYAGATIDALKPDGTPKSRWDVVAEYKQVEGTLPRGPDAARGSVIIRKGEELWLPAGKLMDHSRSRMTWGQFTSCLAEIGWRHKEIDVREPATRNQRADGSKARPLSPQFLRGDRLVVPRVSRARVRVAQRDVDLISSSRARTRPRDTRDTGDRAACPNVSQDQPAWDTLGHRDTPRVNRPTVVSTSTGGEGYGRLGG